MRSQPSSCRDAACASRECREGRDCECARRATARLLWRADRGVPGMWLVILAAALATVLAGALLR